MDNFDLKKYLVENKVTTNSRMMNENEEDFSVELLVPKIYFNVETGELAETPAAFGAKSELKNMDITNYSDGEELIEWVFDGSLEKAKYFEKEYPGLFKVVGGSKMMNEVEGPESITVKVTAEGKNSMDLYNSPESITMQSTEDQLYYIGNQKYEVNKKVNVYFASYSSDPAIIHVSYVAASPENDFKELVSRKIVHRNRLKNIVPYAACDFAGFEKGMQDNRGYFEIV